MKNRSKRLFAVLVAMAALTSCRKAEEKPQAPPPPLAPHITLEAYPDDIAQSIAVHEQDLATKSTELSRGFSSIIRSRQHRWAPGATIKVAFYGGNEKLYSQIESVAQQWTGADRANVTLSFKDGQGKYRLWSPNDKDYHGDIRVGFNGAAYGDYWSLVGIDSRDDTIKGGAANQQSMNLQDFDKKLPWDWDVTVLHEFGHAMGFEHEHQSPAAKCGFRFEDDPGYVQTKDAEGWFTLDENNRRPGLYTYLGGYRNFWSKAKIDQNLKQLAPSSAYEVGPYDNASIMEYMFDAFMFSDGRSSPCYVDRQTARLSKLDIDAVHRAYPAKAADRAQLEVAIRRDSAGLSRIAEPDSRFKESIANRRAYQQNAF